MSGSARCSKCDEISDAELDEMYCSSCYKKLTNEIERLKVKIDELEHQIQLKINEMRNG